MTQNTILSANITLTTKEENLNGELSTKVFYECFFCGKKDGLLEPQRKICEKLSGEEYYCTSCLRNGFNTKKNKHVLILTYRAIIGFYYYYLYLDQKKLYQSQIEDYLTSQFQVGMLNPAFSYDHESLLWFVDFTKVGKGRKRIHLREIIKTIINMLICLNIPENVENINTADLYNKFKDAVEKFYDQRYRPEGKKILVPTLVGCGNFQKLDFEEYRDFARRDLMIRI